MVGYFETDALPQLRLNLNYRGRSRLGCIVGAGAGESTAGTKASEPPNARYITQPNIATPTNITTKTSTIAESELGSSSSAILLAIVQPPGEL